MRDMQRSKVDAALVVWAEHMQRANTGGALDLEQARGVVLQLTRSAWFRRRWPEVPLAWPTGVVVRAYHGRGQDARASLEDGILVPSWQVPIQAGELLRLLAHVATGPQHDWRWGRCMLELARHQYGPQLAGILRAELARRHVPHRKPKQLTPEALARLRAHAAAVFTRTPAEP